MGFLEGLGKMLKEIGEAAFNNPSYWYEHGKANGLNGQASKYGYYLSGNLSKQFLDLYEKGYNEGIKERKSRR